MNGQHDWQRSLQKIQDFNGVWTHDLAIPVRCSTNWAMKQLTLGADQLWVHMFPWKKWVLMIYEINHIWTAQMKWKWRNDRRSERNLCNCVKKPEKPGHYLYTFDWRQDHLSHMTVWPFAGQRAQCHSLIIFRLWVLMQPQGSNPWHLDLQSSPLWTELASPATELIPSYIKTCTRRTVEYFLRVSASHRFLHILNFHPIVTDVNFLLTISINNKTKNN